MAAVVNVLFFCREVCLSPIKTVELSLADEKIEVLFSHQQHNLFIKLEEMPLFKKQTKNLIDCMGAGWLKEMGYGDFSF